MEVRSQIFPVRSRARVYRRRRHRVAGLSLPAAALGHHHAVVLVLVRDCALVVDVQDGDGIEPGRYAADASGLARVVGIEDRLHDGVLSRRQVVAQREITPSRTLVRLKQHHIDPGPR